MKQATLLQKMETLISQPLLSAVKANTNMAMAQMQFMLDNCFTKQTVDGADIYSPVMIKMELTNNVITPGSPAIAKTDEHEAIPATETAINTITTTFNLPLLTIIPMNSLAIDTFTVGIDLQNLYAESPKESIDLNNTETSDENIIVKECKLDVHVGQLPLPSGVLTIIDAYSKNITPITLPND